MKQKKTPTVAPKTNSTLDSKQNDAAKAKEASDERLSAFQSFDANDPLLSVIALIEKRSRNLEKRKTKGLQLREMLDQGKPLNDDQKASAQKVVEVCSCLDLLKEMNTVINNLRHDQTKAKAKAGKPAPPAVATTNPPTNAATEPPQSTSSKNDTVKLLIEIQSNLKKVQDSAECLKALPTADEKVLKAEEIEKLLKFCKIVLSTPSVSDNAARIKKMTYTYQLLLDLDQKLISPDIGLNYAQIYSLIQKIPLTMHHCRLAKESSHKRTPVPGEDHHTTSSSSVITITTTTAAAAAASSSTTTQASSKKKDFHLTAKDTVEAVVPSVESAAAAATSAHHTAATHLPTSCVVTSAANPTTASATTVAIQMNGHREEETVRTSRGKVATTVVVSNVGDANEEWIDCSSRGAASDKKRDQIARGAAGIRGRFSYPRGSKRGDFHKSNDTPRIITEESSQARPPPAKPTVNLVVVKDITDSHRAAYRGTRGRGFVPDSERFNRNGANNRAPGGFSNNRPATSAVSARP